MHNPVAGLYSTDLYLRPSSRTMQIPKIPSIPAPPKTRILTPSPQDSLLCLRFHCSRHLSYAA